VKAEPPRCCFLVFLSIIQCFVIQKSDDNMYDDEYEMDVIFKIH
jgi:hypothetical protein